MDSGVIVKWGILASKPLGCRGFEIDLLYYCRKIYAQNPTQHAPTKTVGIYCRIFWLQNPSGVGVLRCIIILLSQNICTKPHPTRTNQDSRNILSDILASKPLGCRGFEMYYYIIVAKYMHKTPPNSAPTKTVGIYCRLQMKYKR